MYATQRPLFFKGTSYAMMAMVPKTKKVHPYFCRYNFFNQMPDLTNAREKRMTDRNRSRTPSDEKTG